MIGDQVSNYDENLTPDILWYKLNLTKMEFNSRIGILMNYDLVYMFNNQYTLTTLGKAVYESLRVMDNAIKMHEKFDMHNNNILEIYDTTRHRYVDQYL